MRLALIITDYGSFNNFLAELASEMIDRGHEIHLITSDEKIINRSDKFDFIAKGIKIKFVDFPRNFNPYYHFKVSKEIKAVLNNINPDLVHIHFTTGIFTTLFSGKLKYPSIGTFHGLGYPVLKGVKKNIFKTIEHFCFKKLDEIWLLNKEDFNLVKKKYKDKTFLYKSSGLGCDLGKFNSNLFNTKFKEELKKELGISASDFVFSFIGRFVYFKGYHLTVKSFLKLNKNFSNIKLITMGGKDNAHSNGLSIETQNELLNNKNIINIGFTDQIEKYLSISDLLVFPSFKEGMPVCVIESLAMGVPVITLNSRGCNDLVSDGYNGFLVEDFHSEEELIIKLSSILNNKSQVEKLRYNIKKDRKIYSREVFINEQIEEYIRLINFNKKKRFIKSH